MEKTTAFHYEHPTENDADLRHRSQSRGQHREHAVFSRSNNHSFHDLSGRTQDAGNPTSPARTPHGEPTTGWGMENFRRENAIVLTPELFEKLYLNPANNVRGDLRERYGNPTPLALLGFLLSLSPLSMELMGWRGAGGNGMATIGAYFFIGGFLMSLGGILEFFLGNTFSFVVFCSFGGFWFTLGATLTPAFNAYGAYSADPNNPALGLESAGFHASFGFFLLFMGFLSLIFLICSLRTNLVFVSIFFGLMMLFAVLTGSYWNTAIGSVELAKQQQFVAGGFGIMATSAGWWIFLAQMLASVDFPIQLPVGDISHLITPWSAKVKAKEQFSA